MLYTAELSARKPTPPDRACATISHACLFLTGLPQTKKGGPLQDRPFEI
ncbi:MAG: hypothetical protein ACI8V5_002060, partial [Limisphaerales bacterium]